MRGRRDRRTRLLDWLMAVQCRIINGSHDYVSYHPAKRIAGREAVICRLCLDVRYRFDVAARRQ